MGNSNKEIFQIPMPPFQAATDACRTGFFPFPQAFPPGNNSREGPTIPPRSLLIP